MSLLGHMWDCWGKGVVNVVVCCPAFVHNCHPRAWFHRGVLCSPPGAYETKMGFELYGGVVWDLMRQCALIKMLIGWVTTQLEECRCESV